MEHSIDSFYTNGKLHGHRGEDYAIHGDNYFIICDGCSSSKESDVVARLQAHISKNFIDTFKYLEYDLEDNAFMIKFIAMQLDGMFKNLRIKGMPLATLIVGFIIEDTVRVVIVGDGNIVYKEKNNPQQYINVSYTNNAPFYPYYYTSQSLINDYIANYPEGEKIVQHEHFFTYEKITAPSIFDFDLKDLEYLYIFSDGIEEFTSNTKLPLKEAVKDFTAMKNTNGTFIERRCKRQLKTYEKNSIFPMDDFSMAGIHA